MAKSIDQMIEDLPRREGGFVNHPADRGGPTNFGITKRTLARYRGRPVDVDEVAELSVDLAAEIYGRQYLRAPRIDALPERIQPFVFDSAVNHGPRRAIRLVQQVCNAAGFGELTLDGINGPNTRRVAVEADQSMGDWLLAALVEERRNFYKLIVEIDPTQEVFLNGWFNRLAEFEVPKERLVA